MQTNPQGPNLAEDKEDSRFGRHLALYTPDRQADSLAANDSWLLSPSASEIRTAEPLCCCCCSPNGLEVSPHHGQRVSNACWHLHNSPVAAENTWLAPSTQNENPYPNPTGIRSKASQTRAQAKYQLQSRNTGTGQWQQNNKQINWNQCKCPVEAEGGRQR